jgi:hypothetical protein
MKLKQISTNAYEVTFKDGTIVLFSYTDAVAAYKPAIGFMKVDGDLTPATRRHVRDWLYAKDADNVVLIQRDAMDNLVGAPTHVEAVK